MKYQLEKRVVHHTNLRSETGLRPYLVWTNIKTIPHLYPFIGINVRHTSWICIPFVTIVEKYIYKEKLCESVVLIVRVICLFVFTLNRSRVSMVH